MVTFWSFSELTHRNPVNGQPAMNHTSTMRNCIIASAKAAMPVSYANVLPHDLTIPFTGYFLPSSGLAIPLPAVVLLSFSVTKSTRCSSKLSPGISKSFPDISKSSPGISKSSGGTTMSAPGISKSSGGATMSVRDIALLSPGLSELSQDTFLSSPGVAGSIRRITKSGPDKVLKVRSCLHNLLYTASMKEFNLYPYIYLITIVAGRSCCTVC